MASIYDITGDKFFTPLASKNRKIYLDTILFLHKTINELFESNDNDKSRIINLLTEHLNNMVSINLYNDETNLELEEELDNYSKAMLLVNKLEDYGWLSEEAIGNGTRILDFNDYSYDFIELINKISENNKTRYTSYVKTIKNAINNFDYSKTDDLKIIDEALSNFIVALRGLRSSIQRYYKNITKNKDILTLELLLDEFTGEYKEYFFDSSYLDLKIRDNVDSELPKIEEQLIKIFSDYLNMEKLYDAKMKEKDFQTYDLALSEIDKIQKRIINNIKTIPSIIEMIDSKNEKYVTRTISVIIHLISRGKDIEGILHRLIDYVKDEDIEDNLIPLFDMTHYSFKFLYKPRAKNEKIIPKMMDVSADISNDVKFMKLKLLQEETKYNIHAINDFVANFLKDKEQRRISELELSSKYEFIMMISIMIYSKMPKALYDIDLLNDKINKNNITFNDFIIKKKGR